jgi:uncharacterized membrane protein
MARDADERRDSPRRTSSRLDVPRDTRRVVPRPSYDPEALGRFSERVARFLGTGAFLAWMTVVIVVWVAWNFWGPEDLRWDDYPFIFLTLVLSLQASYSAPLILLAQNRQEGRDRVNLEQDREQSARFHADMEYLAREVASLRMAVGEVATRDYVRSELRSLLAELDGRAGSDSEGRSSDEPGSPRSLDA